jgi:hypothetical protein
LTSRRFFVAALGALGLLSIAVPALNYRLDFYGLFGGAGRPRNIYMNERTSKYLMARSYIPSNFDGLLIGSSISDNWDTRQIQGFKVYNGSIAGGNISEEKLVAEQVFQRGHVRLAIFVVYPYLTVDHGRKSGFMTESEYWGALGSPQLLLGYGSRLLAGLGLEADAFNAYGVRDFTLEIKPVDARAEMAKEMDGLRRMRGADPYYQADPVALGELSALVAQARAAGARIAVVYPPVYRERLELRRKEIEDYQGRVASLWRAGDLIIDLNAPGQGDIGADTAAFFDTSHLTRDGAARAVAAIDRALAAYR